jgi:hypothetical protein
LNKSVQFWQKFLRNFIALGLVIGLGMTGLFRTSTDPFWILLRRLVRERGIDPDTSLLADSFEDDVNFEFGILVPMTGASFSMESNTLTLRLKMANSRSGKI